MALSIATGVLKAVLVMATTPMAARFMGLNNPRSAMIFGGLAGTVSGVAGGLAATDEKLVPLWRADGDLSHRAWLPALPLDPVPAAQGFGLTRSISMTMLKPSAAATVAAAKGAA
jgi:hypothetical protein